MAHETSDSKAQTAINICCPERNAVRKIVVERIWHFALQKSGHKRLASSKLGGLKVALYHSSVHILAWIAIAVGILPFDLVHIDIPRLFQKFMSGKLAPLDCILKLTTVKGVLDTLPEQLVVHQSNRSSSNETWRSPPYHKNSMRSLWGETPFPRGEKIIEKGA